MCFGEVTSQLKRHHVYNYEYKVGENLICEMEPTNKHRQNATAVKNKDQKVIIRSRCFRI